ncbi:MAG: hypothetical protein GVY22_12785 [Gammaproteobacteria bacterium]|jgi:hypothetical protein|nr:hypothetical protein [Gammaproteobacteria bacterium]
MRYLRRIVSLGLLLVVANAGAATLEVTRQESRDQQWENGRLVEDRASAGQGRQPQATPDSLALSASQDLPQETCPGQSGCDRTAEATFVITAQIQPGAGESNGDAVVYCATWSGEVASGAKADSAAAAASGGGIPSTTASAPNTASASVSEPAFVAIQGGATYAFGQLSNSAPPDAAESDASRQDIHAVIGDTIEASVAVALSSAAPFDGAANAQGASRLTLALGSCVAKPVPAASSPSLAVLLTVMLGLSGYLVFRQRQSQ